MGKRKVTSPPDFDDDFAIIESTLAPSILSDLPVQDTLKSLQTIMSFWGDLVHNAYTVGWLLTLLKEQVTDHKEKAEMGLADAEFATALLATKIGNRPVSLGTDSIFQMLDDLVSKVGSVRDEIKRLNSPELEQILVDKVGLAVGQEVLTHLRPLFLLFWNLSSGPAMPGDFLKTRLKALEA